MAFIASWIGTLAYPHLDHTDWRKNPSSIKGFVGWSILHYIDFFIAITALRGVVVSIIIVIRLLFVVSMYLGVDNVVKYF